LKQWWIQISLCTDVMLLKQPGREDEVKIGPGRILYCWHYL